MPNIETRPLLKVAAVVLVVCLVVQCWPPISEFLYHVGAAFVPIIVGFAFAFAANIPMSSIERHVAPNSVNPRVASLRRPVSLTLTIVLVVGVLALFLILVIPQFAHAIFLLQQNIPAYIESLKGSVGSDLLESVRQFFTSGDQGEAIDQQDFSKILSNAGGFIGGLTNGIIGFASSAVSVVMAALLSTALLAEKETFQNIGLRVMNSYLGQERSDRIMHVLSVFNVTFRGFLVKQFADAFILGLMVALAMFLLGLPYPAAVGALVGLCALIPMIGVYVGMALGGFLVFAVSPIQAIAFLVVAFVLTQVEASFVSPIITKSTLGIPGIWVLICITVFGAIWGIMGILVGVPTFASLFKLLNEDLDKREGRAARGTAAK